MHTGDGGNNQMSRLIEDHLRAKSREVDISLSKPGKFGSKPKFASVSDGPRGSQSTSFLNGRSIYCKKKPPLISNAGARAREDAS